MRYLLDTNIFIAAMKGQAAVKRRLETTPLGDLVLSPVVYGELALGVAKSQAVEKNAQQLARVTQAIDMPSIDVRVARHYAEIRASLEQQGRPIGGNDFWIAAQALALGATLVSDNLREFSRIPDLLLENWLSDSV